MRSGLFLNIEIRVAGQGGCDVVVYMIRRTRGHIRGALMDLDFYFFVGFRCAPSGDGNLQRQPFVDK